MCMCIVARPDTVLPFHIHVHMRDSVGAVRQQVAEEYGCVAGLCTHAAPAVQRAWPVLAVAPAVARPTNMANGSWTSCDTCLWSCCSCRCVCAASPPCRCSLLCPLSSLPCHCSPLRPCQPGHAHDHQCQWGPVLLASHMPSCMLRPLVSVRCKCTCTKTPKNTTLPGNFFLVFNSYTIESTLICLAYVFAQCHTLISSE